MIETLDDILAELQPKRARGGFIRKTWEAETADRIRRAVGIETALGIGFAVLEGLETRRAADTPDGKGELR